MTISVNTVFEVRTGGSDTNGGGFVTGASGTDYSQQDAAQLTVTDGACSATTTVTSATGGFTSAMVGNLIYLSSGPGWYEITAYTDTNTITIDRAGPNATGMTLNIGGALASPGGLSQVFNSVSAVNGTRAWIQAGTYTLTTATAYTSGGPLHIPDAMGCIVAGYQTTRGDEGTKPVLDAGAITSVSLVKSPVTSSGTSANYIVGVDNIKVDGQSNSSVIGFDGALVYQCRYINCEAVDCTTGFNKVQSVGCLATSCTTGFNSCHTSLCVADSCGTGFSSVSSANLCVAYDCTGDGFTVTRAMITNCTAYQCGGDGFDLTPSNRTGRCVGCLSVGNTGYGFRMGNNSSVMYSATYNNTAGAFLDTNYNYQKNNVVLTADPFVSATSDMSLNTTAGGGADIIAAGVLIPGQTVTNKIGAVDSVGGGGGGGGLLRVGANGGIFG